MNGSKGIKMISIISAVFLLIAAIALPSSASDGVSYRISVESGSDVYQPDPSSVTVNAGKTYTFCVPDDIPTSLYDEDLGEYAVRFSNWRFTGAYEVIQGIVDEDGDSFDRTVVLKPLSDIKAVACFYEDNAAFYMVDVTTDNPDYEPYIEQGECPKGDQWTFSVPDDISGFIRWEFTGSYEVIAGKVDENGFSTDRNVVLKPQSGIQAFARFYEAEEPTEGGRETGDLSTPDETKGNDSKTSPKTGDMTFAVAGILFLAFVAGAAAIGKLKE